jgi:hypothetical protein
MAPAANRAAIVSAGATSASLARVPAGTVTAGSPQHAAAVAASPASGPAATIRSVFCAARVIAWANSTGWLACRPRLAR